MRGAFGSETGRSVRIGVGVCACAVTALGSLAGAQVPQPVERVEVARIIIDARVVDEQGSPFLGLEPADFDVRIGGRQVRVESAPWIGGAPVPPTRRSTVTAAGRAIEFWNQGRLVVFVVQKSLVPVRARGLLRLLQQVGSLLERLNPDDHVAVLLFDFHLKIWLDFTNDFDAVRTMLAEQVMFGTPPGVVPGDVSLIPRLSQEAGRRTYRIEEALHSLGDALEPLPGAKSIVLIGHGFGELTANLNMFGSRLDRRYAEAQAALQVARAAVFSLDTTDAAYHTFEHGLQLVAEDTGGFFVRTNLSSRRAVERVGNALAGHYVLFTERPELEAGTHRIEVKLRGRKGRVFARRDYVE